MKRKPWDEIVANNDASDRLIPTSPVGSLYRLSWGREGHTRVRKRVVEDERQNEGNTSSK